MDFCAQNRYTVFMSRIKEIAEKLKVSVSAVSYVSSGKWREKRISQALALRIQKELTKDGYQADPLALQLRTGKTRTIGVVLSDLTKTHNMEILMGIERALVSEKYFVLLAHSDLGKREPEILENFIQRKVEGFIIGFASAKPQEGLELLLKSGSTLVLVDNIVEGKKISGIVSDNLAAAKKAVLAMTEMGCQKIAYLGSQSRTFPSLRERFEGYQQALEEKKLSVPPHFTQNYAPDPEGMRRALEKLFAREKPDGIFCDSFLYFHEAFQVFKEWGLQIPRDLKLAGFDALDFRKADQAAAFFSQTVTAPIPYIEQDAVTMGESAANKLLGLLKRKSKAEIITIPSRLVHF